MDEYRIVLKNYLKHDNFTINSYKIVPFDKPLKGLIGQHYHLYIDFNENNQAKQQRFFLKTLSNNPTMLELSKIIKVYEKEEFFYKFLKPQFEDYLQIDTSYLPNYYHSKPYSMILEDCELANYKGTNKRQQLDLEHCRICLGILAKFHSSSLIYATEKRINLLDEYSDILKNYASSSKYIECAIASLYDLIDEFLPDSNQIKQKLTTIIERIENGEIGGDLTDIKTILHGDLWTSNFLYHYKDNKPIKGKLLDFQTITYGPIQIDLLQFLMTNLRKDFRNRHYYELISFYYDEFKQNLLNYNNNNERIGVSLPVKSDFIKSCDDFKIIGKLHAIIDHSITFISEDSYLKILQSKGGLVDLLYTKRSEIVIGQCYKDEDYKNLLLEDLLELKDLLYLLH